MLDIYRRGFVLLDADEYSLAYMENNKHIFPLADADAVIADLRKQSSELKSKLATSVKELASDGCITPENLEKVLKEQGIKAEQHQIIALKRKLTKEGNSTIEVHSLFQTLDISE